eukprot:TRINITY_DN23427_c0_g1_i1.p1 TRINITY_DN23427_c0_g1~~TRINITY_DN23427_c0_g1_i1.p1  ORF type:complete len:113 (+),score=2.47 TRINITY_DN23427_c0_g1_i1:2-340(+)
MVSLFFYVLQHSSLLKSVIMLESFLVSSFYAFPSEYLTASSSWNWLCTVIRIINDLNLVSNIINNTLMWAVLLQSEVVISIDQNNGDVSCSKQSDFETKYLIPYHIKKEQIT